MKTYVDLYLEKLIEQTEKAYLIKVKSLEEPFWVPKKLTLGIDHGDEISNIEKWFADKNGLPYERSFDL